MTEIMGNVASAAAASGHSGGPPAAGSLSEAAANGDVAAITAILSGSNNSKEAAARLVNAADGDGWTSVHFASYGGSAPALALLLEAGGDAGKQDKGGRAPLSLAALRGNLACAAALLKSDKRAGGVNLLGMKDSHGMQATHKAAVAGQAQMLELLLKLGADPDAAASDGSTPAHMAAYKGHVDALRALLVGSPGKMKVGNALARRKDGLSVLAEAAAQGQENAVSFLLSLPGVRATIAETDKSGSTAMDLAAARGHSRVVAELRRAAGLPPASAAEASSALAPAAAPAAPATAAAGGGAYPSLYQGGGTAAAASAAATVASPEQPAAAQQQQSWWQQAVNAATGVSSLPPSSATPAAAAAAVVDPQAASDWWQQAIGREPSELPPPPASAVVAAAPAAASEEKKEGGKGLLDDRKAFEAAALAKAQGLYRALAGKNRKPATSNAVDAGGGAPSSSSKQPAAREEKYDLEPYDSDDYEEEAPTSADPEGERPLPSRTARERAAITTRLAQLELAADAAHGWTRGGSKADGSKAARDARVALARQEKEIAFLKQQLAAAASGARPGFSLPPAFLDARTPLEFVCPITRQVMRDPVIAADGQSYERAAITAFLQAGNVTSPVSGQRLSHPGLVRNAALATAISDWKAQQGQRRGAFGGLGSLSLTRRQQQAPAYA